ncbi:MAG: type II toxin-antitoxin system VapC family toxin [Acidobacteria bacterium]|nr:MAG: type II toxin-antitoxin system VapC family toxin [Acidobacteriota bacterium]
MIIDASALVAIVLSEPEADRFTTAVSAATVRLMAAVNWLETLVVVDSRKSASGVTKAQGLRAELGIQILPADEGQIRAAHEAWRRYGKGRHRARLNLGDCCAYAASVTLNEPLLFKGNDFSLTDVEVADW